MIELSPAGNHDYYTGDIDKWLNIWHSQGLKVLHNRRVDISNGKDRFYLIGLDDKEGAFFRYIHSYYEL